jgi:UrcA family protein
MMTSLRLPVVLAINSFVLASVLAAPGAGYAESLDKPLTYEVRFGELNLDARAGAEVLYRRIQNAARNVCGPAERTGSHIRSAAWEKCVASAVRTAVYHVDRPVLTGYYLEQDGHGIEQRPQRAIARR